MVDEAEERYSRSGGQLVWKLRNEKPHGSFMKLESAKYSCGIV